MSSLREEMENRFLEDKFNMLFALMDELGLDEITIHLPEASPEEGKPELVSEKRATALSGVHEFNAKEKETWITKAKWS